jgi:ABC-type spermidine/putrescine transport system permease subunit II
VILFSFNHPPAASTTSGTASPSKLAQLERRARDPERRQTSLEIARSRAPRRHRARTLIALALVRHRFHGSGTTNLLIFVPMTAPEIVLGASLLTLFVSWNTVQGFNTILIAHIMFNISYVVVTVKARLVGFDRHLEEAAMDLGATEWTTFRKVTLPLIMPGILAAGLLAFALSIDDFVITYFNAGATTTFPLFVWGAARVATPPQINVIGTAIFVVAVTLMLANIVYQRSRDTGSMSSPMTGMSHAELQQAARDHLWLHFTRMGGYTETEVPIIVRGEGCYLEDTTGKRYLDALAGLFAVNIGYSYGDEIGQAAHEQMRELPFYTNWSYAHPRAIELAATVAELAPGDLNRVFFVSGGSEAVESAWKLARQYHTARGERRWKAISRNVAYHGTTMGALSINGVPALRAPFEPLVPSVAHVHNTNRYHRPPTRVEAVFTQFLLDDLEHTISAEGADTVAMVIMEPVQNAGGCFTPPRATGAACGRSATGTGSCSAPTR